MTVGYDSVVNDISDESHLQLSRGEASRSRDKSIGRAVRVPAHQQMKASVTQSARC